MNIDLLIVDDAIFMQNLISKMIEEELNLTIKTANNGKEAIEKYKKHLPKIVTMDMTMPEMSGLKALDEILKINEDANIIMCSAMGQKPMVLESLEHGAKDFIVKPIKKQKLLKVIKKYL